MLFMVEHLNQHKGQLFYYLKLQGKPVKTPDLWGGRRRTVGLPGFPALRRN
jgi:uncharacterized damage-inducible protein DinB